MSTSGNGCLRRTIQPARLNARSRLDRWRLGLQTARDLLECGVAMGLLAGLILVLSLLIPTWRSSADRLFTPWRFVPQVGSIRIVDVQPGNSSA